jgi:hypothetical protein
MLAVHEPEVNNNEETLIFHPSPPRLPTMDSIIETQRATHEEIERYEQALAEVLMQNPQAVSHAADTMKGMSIR